VTLIVVTHDQGMGARARRQLVMEDGRLKSDSQQTPISNLAEISG
ncbi:MAG: macrolide ABC transporter ATP-binding protein, partial [Dechloromonas sp.]|nr:macrolide ABC transporter ATP-binding protein [Dechloromonas sp.]